MSEWAYNACDTVFSISHFAGVVNGIACYYLSQRLHIVRECSNRSGDVPFWYFNTDLHFLCCVTNSSVFLNFFYVPSLVKFITIKVNSIVLNTVRIQIIPNKLYNTFNHQT